MTKSPVARTTTKLSTPSQEATAILSALPLDDAADAPEWMHLFHNGVNQTVDGRGPFKVVDAAVIAANSIRPGDRLPIDVNHAIDVAAPMGQPSPAVGWMTELQARDTGLWARVEWTATGKSLLAEKAYRHQSPVVRHTKDGTVKAILRASLTNNPNLRDLVALNSVDPDMTLLNSLRAALKLDDKADETACLAAVTELVSTGTDAVSTLSAIGAELKLGTDATSDAMLAAIRARSGALADQVSQLQVEIVEQSKELKRLRDDGKRADAERFVDDAIKRGVAGVKPNRDHYISRHMVDPAAVEKEFAALPVVQGRLDPPPGTGTTSRLSAEATAEEIAAAADRLIKEQADKGISLNFAQAVRQVSAL